MPCSCTAYYICSRCLDEYVLDMALDSSSESGRRDYCGQPITFTGTLVWSDPTYGSHTFNVTPKTFDALSALVPDGYKAPCWRKADGMCTITVKPASKRKPVNFSNLRFRSAIVSGFFNLYSFKPDNVYGSPMQEKKGAWIGVTNLTHSTTPPILDARQREVAAFAGVEDESEAMGQLKVLDLSAGEDVAVSAMSIVETSESGRVRSRSPMPSRVKPEKEVKKGRGKKRVKKEESSSESD